MATPEEDATVEEVEDILTLKVTLCKNETDADHKLKLAIKENIISAMVDSGTEISVLHERCLPKDYADPVGKVMLKGAFGHRVSAKLVTIPIRIHDENVQIDSMIYCAVTPTLDAGCDCLLTPKDHKLLQKTKERNLKLSENVKNKDVTALHLNGDERRNLRSLMKQVDDDDDDDDGDDDYDGDDDGNEIKILYLSNEEMNSINRTLSITEVQTTTIPNEENTSIVDPTIETSQNIENIRKEQQEDETLKEAIESLKIKNTQYYVRSLDGLLFHVENVNGREVHQLVLPKNRRQEVLKLAHDSEWAGHLAYKKTKQRINMVFFWPRMKEDIKEYCRTCNSCQMKRKVTCYDQVPINAVMRPEQPFEVINIDVIGPFSQKSNGCAYVLTMIDQFSRWPEAIQIKNLKATTICDALLWIWTRTGIPKNVVMDNATYFKAELTDELTKKLGTKVRFSTPYFPQGNAVVERWNGVIKGMIHHAIHNGVKEWHKMIPFSLSAYREVPNETTGVAPYEMIYGYQARGILSALRETWTGEYHKSQTWKKSTKDYLEKLKQQLNIVKQIAIKTCKKTQPKYVKYKNKNSKEKKFTEGEEVIILMPDSTQK